MPLELPTQQLPTLVPQEGGQMESQDTPPAILIVDDDPDILTALYDLLEHEDLLVTGVATCHEALAQIQATNFSAVLLDIGLPDGNGLAVLETIQAIAPALPVIVLTAFTSKDYRAKSFSGGAFSYLTKPYNCEELRAVVHRAIKIDRPSISSKS